MTAGWTPPLTVTDLRARTRFDETFRYRLFYGHTPRADGQTSDAIFSQFWPCAFTIDGQRCRWAEQWMMSEKARLFGDMASLERIMAADDPAAVKRAGRAVSPYNDQRWGAVRYDCVVEGNFAKFGQDDALCEYLLATGNDVLVEATPADAIWGIGLGRDHPDAADPSRWRGQNLLGFALMQVRALLRDRATPITPPPGTA